MEHDKTEPEPVFPSTADIVKDSLGTMMQLAGRGASKGKKGKGKGGANGKGQSKTGTKATEPEWACTTV